MSTDENNHTFNQPVTNESQVPTPAIMKRRGRPKVDVQWPSEDFTFANLTQANGRLSTSSLRKKMRAELTKGGLLKVGTLKTAFGRPQDVYKKP